MPITWGATKRQDIHIGGGEGTVSEASSVKSWPNYDAAYLAKRLGAREPEQAYNNRFTAGREGNWTDQAARQVYLEKVASNFREEADECLKAEFMQWLEGSHEDNYAPREYLNLDGQQRRRAIHPVTEPDLNGQPVLRQAGETLTNWKPTWWNTNQLTHLDGVREFLREKKIHEEEHEFALNVLAEYGPNNIDQAWTYFKCWVKGRPVRPEECAPKRNPAAVEGTLDDTKRSAPVSMAESRSSILNAMPPPSAAARASAAASAVSGAAASVAASAAQNAMPPPSSAAAAVPMDTTPTDPQPNIAQVNAAAEASIAPTTAELAAEAVSHVTNQRVDVPFLPPPSATMFPRWSAQESIDAAEYAAQPGPLPFLARTMLDDGKTTSAERAKAMARAREIIRAQGSGDKRFTGPAPHKRSIGAAEADATMAPNVPARRGRPSIPELSARLGGEMIPSAIEPGPMGLNSGLRSERYINTMRGDRSIQPANFKVMPDEFATDLGSVPPVNEGEVAGPAQQMAAAQIANAWMSAPRYKRPPTPTLRRPPRERSDDLTRDDDFTMF